MICFTHKVEHFQLLSLTILMLNNTFKQTVLKPSILLGLSLCILYCSEQHLHEGSYYIDVESGISENFNEVVKDVELIPLELTDSSALKEVGKVVFFKDLVYVLDRRSYAIFVFTQEGVFVNKISNPSDLPGGIYVINDFLLNEENGTLLLLSPRGKVVSYSIEDGAFSLIIEEPELLSPVSNFVELPNGNILFYAPLKPFQLIEYSIKEQSVVYESYPKPDKVRPSIGFFSPFVFDDEVVKLLDPFNCSFVIYDDGETIETGVIEFSKGDFNSVDFTSQDRPPSNFAPFLEENGLNYPILCYAENLEYKGVTAAYQAATANSYLFNSEINKWIQIEIPLSSKFVPFLECMDDTFLGVALEPRLLDELFPKEEWANLYSNKKFSELEDGNPVLIKYRISE